MEQALKDPWCFVSVNIPKAWSAEEGRKKAEKKGKPWSGLLSLTLCLSSLTPGWRSQSESAFPKGWMSQLQCSALGAMCPPVMKDHFDHWDDAPKKLNTAEFIYIIRDFVGIKAQRRVCVSSSWNIQVVNPVVVFVVVWWHITLLYLACLCVVFLVIPCSRLVLSAMQPFPTADKTLEEEQKLSFTDLPIRHSQCSHAIVTFANPTKLLMSFFFLRVWRRGS